PFPNPVFPGSTMLKDPGAKPSITAGVRWQSDSGHDNVYVVADAINDGTWGYNNLQWYGVTWYHKFNDQWHFAWENYVLGQRNVLNKTDPAGIIRARYHPVQRAEFCAMQRSHRAHLYRACDRISDVFELQGDTVGQRVAEARVLS